MFIELVDLLRCPEPHRDSWLVARMDRVVDRRIIHGALGCPVCGREYQIENGIVYFAAASAPAAGEPQADVAMRIAAALGLTAANNVAVLQGGWGAHARLVHALGPAQLLLLDPPADAASDDGISILRADAVPLRAAAVDGAAVEASASDAVRRALIRVVKTGGRVISQSALVDDDLSEVLATDSVWIGEVHHAGPKVPLQRVPRPIKRL